MHQPGLKAPKERTALSKIKKEILVSVDFTFIISGSFQGPLLERRHPPSPKQEHEPPRNSGN